MFTLFTLQRFCYLPIAAATLRKILKAARNFGEEVDIYKDGELIGFWSPRSGLELY